MMKNNIQAIFVFAIHLFLLGTVWGAGPADLAWGPYVTYPSPDTARIIWHTRQPSPTRLDYGPAGPDARHCPTYHLTGAFVGKLDQRMEDSHLKLEHHCDLTGLSARRIYAYRIQVGSGVNIKTSPVYPLDMAFNYAVPDLQPVHNPFAGSARHAAVQEGVGQLLTETGARPGIALVWGLQDGHWAYELATQSRLTVIGLDDDRERIARIRKHLYRAGVYGARLSLRSVESLDRLALPSHLANLVVSERFGDGQPPTAADLRELQRVLRPHGGTLWLPDADGRNQIRRDVRQGDFPGTWTHQYGDTGNTANSRADLSGVSRTDQLQVQWLGKPGADFGIDRNPRMPAPLAVSGKLFHQGMNRMVALDSFNGSILWSLEIPDLRRVNLPRDASNWCTDERSLFVAVRDRCWVIDHNDGSLLQTYSLPTGIGRSPHEWGFVARLDEFLLGSVVRQGSSYRDFWGKNTWYDKTQGFGTGKVCSERLFAYDVTSAQPLWAYRQGLIVNTTVGAVGDRVYFVETRNPTARKQTDRRLNDTHFWQDQFLVALNLQTGDTVWEQALDTIDGVVVFFLACTDDTILVSASAQGQYHLYAYEAETGQGRWANEHPWPSDNHSGHMQHPVLFDDRVFLEPCGYDLVTGKRLTEAMGRHEGCATYCGTEHALLFRGPSRRIAMWDIREEKTTTWFNLRPSCWLSTIAADGMVLLPEGGGGCSCGNWLETSLGLVPVLSR